MCDKRMIIMNKIIKKSNHVYIGKEARYVERKTTPSLKNGKLNGKYLQANEFVCYQQVC